MSSSLGLSLHASTSAIGVICMFRLSLLMLGHGFDAVADIRPNPVDRGEKFVCDFVPVGYERFFEAVVEEPGHALNQAVPDAARREYPFGKGHCPEMHEPIPDEASLQIGTQRQVIAGPRRMRTLLGAVKRGIDPALLLFLHVEQR